MSSADIETLKNIAEKIDQNLLRAISRFSTYNVGNQKKYIDSINNTYAAHNYNIIIDSLINDTILSVSRIVEKRGKDRCSLDYALSLLNKEDNQLELSKLYFRDDLTQFKNLFDENRAKFHQLMKKDDTKKAIKDYRDIHLAHSLNKLPGNTFTYANLENFLDELIPIIENLLTCMSGIRHDYEGFMINYKRYAKSFWDRLL